jgi:hypothetical protein
MRAKKMSARNRSELAADLLAVIGAFVLVETLVNFLIIGTVQCSCHRLSSSSSFIFWSMRFVSIVIVSNGSSSM